MRIPALVPTLSLVLAAACGPKPEEVAQLVAAATEAHQDVFGAIGALEDNFAVCGGHDTSSRGLKDEDRVRMGTCPRNLDVFVVAREQIGGDLLNAEETEWFEGNFGGIYTGWKVSKNVASNVPVNATDNNRVTIVEILKEVEARLGVKERSYVEECKNDRPLSEKGLSPIVKERTAYLSAQGFTDNSSWRCTEMTTGNFVASVDTSFVRK
ncbi:MAG: hypothetical protein WC846_04310 [Candidatus Gracilibacteria bacterium]|jgi:hypothetical protein